MASPNVLKVCFKNFALKVAETTAISLNQIILLRVEKRE